METHTLVLGSRSPWLAARGPHLSLIGLRLAVPHATTCVSSSSTTLASPWWRCGFPRPIVSSRRETSWLLSGSMACNSCSLTSRVFHWSSGASHTLPGPCSVEHWLRPMRAEALSPVCPLSRFKGFATLTSLMRCHGSTCSSPLGTSTARHRRHIPLILSGCAG